MDLKKSIVKYKSWYEKGNLITYIPRNTFGMFSEVFTPLLVLTHDWHVSLIVAAGIGITYFVSTMFIGRFWSEKGMMKEQTNFELQEHRNDTPKLIAQEVLKLMKEEGILIKK